MTVSAAARRGTKPCSAYFSLLAAKPVRKLSPGFDCPISPLEPEYEVRTVHRRLVSSERRQVGSGAGLTIFGRVGKRGWAKKRARELSTTL